MSRRTIELKLSAADVARFWRHAVPSATPDECWKWTGSVSGDGYAVVLASGNTRNAHRVSYIIATGEQVPSGLVLDHLCRNRACVNPEHLEPVTNKVNLLRGNTLVAANRAKTTCPRGHQYDDFRYGQRKCTACRRIRDKAAAV